MIICRLVVLGGVGGSHAFHVERKEDQSSTTEYRRGTVEYLPPKEQPMRLEGGRGEGGGKSNENITEPWEGAGRFHSETPPPWDK